MDDYKEIFYRRNQQAAQLAREVCAPATHIQIRPIAFLGFPSSPVFKSIHCPALPSRQVWANPPRVQTHIKSNHAILAERTQQPTVEILIAGVLWKQPPPVK